MILKKLISAAASVMLLLSAAASGMPPKANAAFTAPALTVSKLDVKADGFSLSDIMMTVDEAADYMRECMRERQSEITIAIPNNVFADEDEAAAKMLAEAMKETDDGRDGDYLRFNLNGYRYGSVERRNSLILQYEIYYYTTAEEEKAVDNAVENIMNLLLLQGRSDYEKITAIYDYVTFNTSYARDKDESDLHIFTAYGAAVEHEAVCQGYSLLFYRLLKDAGISCRIISGTSRGVRHTWNIAKVGDKYYLLDPTWDSPFGSTGGAFFLKGTEDFEEESREAEHTPVYEYEIIFPDYESEEFKAEYPISPTKLPVPEYTLGDLDANGIIDGRDATKVLTAYAVASVWREYPLLYGQKKVADVTGDGIVDGRDASMILSFYAASSAGKADNFIDFVHERTGQ